MNDPFDGERLAMEYEHPAWKEGKKAYQNGVKYDDNPHPYGTEECAAWAQGWQEEMGREDG